MTEEAGLSEPQDEVFQLLKALFLALTDETHELWGRTPSEIRQMHNIQTDHMPLSDIASIVAPATEHFAEWLEMDNDGADNVDWNMASTLFSLAMTVMFGTTDEDIITFTPRALADFAEATRKAAE